MDSTAAYKLCDLAGMVRERTAQVLKMNGSEAMEVGWSEKESKFSGVSFVSKGP